MENKIEYADIGGPGSIPGFLFAGHKYCCLSTGLDVVVDGVTYHLASEFTGKVEMGVVIDTIEVERSQRKPA